MGWIFAAVVFLTVVWLLIASETFRGLAVLGVAVIVGLLVWSHFDGQRKEREALQLIAPSEVELRGLVLKNNAYSVSLNGSVKNRSTNHELESVALRIKIHECRTPESCEIISEEVVSIIEFVPPGQTRYFDTFTLLSTVDFPDGWQWSYDVEEVRAVVD